jgi:hypothetical protein
MIILNDMEIIDHALPLSSRCDYYGHDLRDTEQRSTHDDRNRGNRLLRDISSVSVSLLQ